MQFQGNRLPVSRGGAIGFAAITAGTIDGSSLNNGSGIPTLLSKSAIPFIHISSGSMGNNGALTALTALPTTYANGAWIWLPAGAIAAGIPAAAAWYWFVGSSTTAGTVYNSTYTSGTPTLGTTTAFVTTGPGAFAGDTTEAAGPSITIAAGALGANGGFRVRVASEANNTAGAKNIRVRYTALGGTALGTATITTQLQVEMTTNTLNRGVTNAQISQNVGANAASQLVINPAILTAIDTTVATTLVLSLQKAVATDNAILNAYVAELLSDGT